MLSNLSIFMIRESQNHLFHNWDVSWRIFLGNGRTRFGQINYQIGVGLRDQSRGVIDSLRART